MRCQDARRLLDLYMDSELDPKTSLEVAEHLERCPACAERFSGEIRLEKGLQDALAKKVPTADATLWARLEARIGEEARSPAGSREARRPALARRAAMGIAAAVVVAVAAWWLRPRSAPLGALGSAACHSHDAYVAAKEPAEVTTTSPAEVRAFFDRTLGLEVRPPDGALLHVVGARRCNFGKTIAAFVMGRRGDEPVSAFVFPARDLAGFPEAKRAVTDGHGEVETTLHGHAVAFASDGERAVIVLASPAVGPLEPLARAFLSSEK